MNELQAIKEFEAMVQFLHDHFPLLEMYEYDLGKVKIYFSGN